MDWVVYSIFAAITSAAYLLSYRMAFQKEDDVMGFTTAEQFLGALLLLPAVLLVPLKAQEAGIPFLAVSTILWAIWTYTNARSSQLTQASLKGIALRGSELIGVLLIGIIILGEAPTINKVLAVALMLVGAALPSLHNLKEHVKSKGILFTVATGLIAAVSLSTDKVGSQYFSPELYAFFLFLIPATLFLFATGIKRTLASIARSWKAIIIVTIFNVANFYLVLLAYRTGEVSSVVPLINLSLIFTTLGGMLLLNEKEHIARKIAGMALVFLGALLIVA